MEGGALVIVVENKCILAAVAMAFTQVLSLFQSDVARAQAIQ